MNERIKEIVKAAGFYVAGNNIYAPTTSDNIADLQEKFAELIVKECANLNFRSTGFVTGEGEDMIRDMIKKHFGVE